MVIIDMASRISKQIRVMTLDTGRLPAATFQMIEMVRERYGVPVEILTPDPAEVASMVTAHGPDLFYNDVPLRMLCCHVRKVRPLERKLKELRAWVVGLRREQSPARASAPKVDTRNGAIKISPLADWSKQQVADYTREHDVPVHPLYAQGYASIGCEPCTRPVQAGEDERAGRWWWELNTQKECGIHFMPDGRAVRSIDVLLDQVLRTRNA